jgi:flagellar biosynthesis GTPase FlhF
MKNFGFLILMLFTFSCTNPEVEFPKEEKEGEAKKQTPAAVYQTPTLLSYPENLSPEIFYYFVALARTNGASDAYFLPVSAKAVDIREGLEKLKNFHGENPVIISLRTDLSFLNTADMETISHIYVIDPPVTVKQGNKTTPVPLSGLADQTQAAQKPDEEKKEGESPQEKPQKEVVEKNTDEEKAPVDSKPAAQQQPQQAAPAANLSLREQMKNVSFLSGILKKIMNSQNISASMEKEAALYLKGKTLPYSRLTLMEKKDNEYQEKFQTGSKRDGLFNALIIYPENEFFLKLTTDREETWNFYFKGLFYSYPFFKLIPPQKSIAEIRSFFTPLNSLLASLSGDSPQQPEKKPQQQESGTQKDQTALEKETGEKDQESEKTKTEETAQPQEKVPFQENSEEKQTEKKTVNGTVISGFKVPDKIKNGTIRIYQILIRPGEKFAFEVEEPVFKITLPPHLFPLTFPMGEKEIRLNKESSWYILY